MMMIIIKLGFNSKNDDDHNFQILKQNLQTPIIESKMSKNNKKDKKPQSANGLQPNNQLQRRELLDCQFTIKKLQQRLNDLTEENLRLKRGIEEVGDEFKEQIYQLTIKKDSNEKRLLVLSNEKTKLQIQNEQKENRIKLLEKNLFDEQQGRLKDIQECKKNFHFQMAKYESQLSEYKLYMGEKEELQQQRQQLRQKISIEKANKLKQIADKEREKVQATDKLKDQMLHKISDMRKNLFSLKREQLTTTTRLTMLQNHQLTSELQYQSKQTQKLIFKNQQYEQKIAQLKQELDIHKQVEEELAKRSHFSKGVIRKLNLRVNQLESEIQKQKDQNCFKSAKLQCSQNLKKAQEDSEKASLNQTNLNISNQNSKRLISTLEQELQKAEKKFVQLLTNYENLKKQKQGMSVKLSIVDQKANQIYKILQKHYDDLVKVNDQSLCKQSKQQDKENPSPYQFNLKLLRQSPVEKWKQEDVKILVQMLLNVIQPYLNKPNLLVPAVRKNIMVYDSFTERKSDSSYKSLPKLSTQRKDLLQNKVRDIPLNIASKIVGSNLRQWGQTIKLSKMCLKRKYKLSQSYRC